MHVLFLTDNYPPETNAPATRTHEHARRWVRAGHRVTVVTGAPNFPLGRVFEGYANRWLAREEKDGVSVLRVKTFIRPNRGFLGRTLDQLSFLFSGFLGGLLPRRPDVVVATSPQFFTAVAGWLLAAVRRRPFVFELRDLWPASIAEVGALRGGLVLRMLERFELFLYRRATAVVAVTEAFRDDLVRRGIDAGKIHVVTNGVDGEALRPQERDAALAAELGVGSAFTVGYLGTHGMAHALENVLAAAERLRDEPDVRFLLVGDGAAREGLVAEARRRGLTNVHLHPGRPKGDVGRLWSLCDVALVHLRNAPLFATVIPSKLFEAMGVGAPVLLAAPYGEAARIVRETGCGTCVSPEDPDALAAAVRTARAEPQRLAVERAAGLRAAARYSRETLAEEMLALLEEIAERTFPEERQERGFELLPSARRARRAGRPGGSREVA